MELNVIKTGNELEVTLKRANKIYILNHEEIKDELNWCLGIFHTKLVLNLTGIRFIDTAGFRLLMELNQYYKNMGKQLVLSNVSEEVEELFELVNATEQFERIEVGQEVECLAA